MMRASKLAIVVSLLTLAVSAAQTKAPPNFSGYWKMDAGKSDFGGAPPPDSAGYVIRHTGGKLTFDYSQNGHTSRVEITTDGQERMTDSTPDAETWTRAFWEGPVLVFEARQRPRPAHESPNIKWTSRWKLSEDGKALTIERQISAPPGQLTQIVVFTKESAPPKETGENNSKE